MVKFMFSRVRVGRSRVSRVSLWANRVCAWLDLLFRCVEESAFGIADRNPLIYITTHTHNHFTALFLGPPG